ncbi:ATP-binding cassette domain-containing protein [Rickettsia bellii]|uniref:ABC transporter family protein n=1 Tax=Rickettsia bellii str. RML Mogi TaxID=1359194 RepID=A0A0F3QK62_RICBE|nr:metal ABC transporter ATP-binding protein [Rickettsia bellii]KJV92602.1 ABC transporter family protein [Rickettsia bellii str. RML Mogi]
MKKPIIEFHNVSKKFGNKLPINNVSFTVKKNNITTLIGPNGAGKTTIVRLMLGLEKPTNGEIIIDPRLKIGYVPQKFNLSSDLPITVKKFLDLLAPNNLTNDIKEIHSFIDLERLKDQKISTLSGGQFQKIVLASSLLSKPDLIILDEPLQSLDVTSQQEFYQLISLIRKKLDITVFMISHDLFTVIKNSDQVICLNGHICCTGTPNAITPNSDFSNALSSLGFYTHHHDHKH